MVKILVRFVTILIGCVEILIDYVRILIKMVTILTGCGRILMDLLRYR